MTQEELEQIAMSTAAEIAQDKDVDAKVRLESAHLCLTIANALYGRKWSEQFGQREAAQRGNTI